MRRERMFRLLVLAIVVMSILSLPQAYAKGPPYAKGTYQNTPVMYMVSSVSNPSAGCGHLGLTGTYGDVAVGNGRVVVELGNAHSNSTYTVSVDQFTQGACDGSWQSVGSVTTNQAGNGLLVQKLNLQSGHSYVFEFKDAQGNLVYATS